MFCAELWKFLLALSGPTKNIHVLKDNVKDSLCITGDKCLLQITFDKIVFRVVLILIKRSSLSLLYKRILQLNF